MWHEVYSEVKWSPDRTALRWFGLGLAGALLLWSLVICGRTHAFPPTVRIPGVLALLLLAGGTLCPGVLLWPYRIWMAITAPVGALLRFVLLCLAFYAVFTPVALLFRVVGRDPLCRRADPRAESYWVPCVPPTDVRRYFRQY